MINAEEEDLESLAGVVVATDNEAIHVGEHIYDRVWRVKVDACSAANDCSAKGKVATPSCGATSGWPSSTARAAPQ